MPKELCSSNESYWVSEVGTRGDSMYSRKKAPIKGWQVRWCKKGTYKQMIKQINLGHPRSHLQAHSRHVKE